MRSFPTPLLLLTLAAACGGSDASPTGTPPQGNVVQATADITFAPASISIAAGDSVTFRFAGVQHTVQFQQGSDSPGLFGQHTSSAGAPPDIGATANSSITRAFPRAGTFEYRCTIHPGMLGEVVVR